MQLVEVEMTVFPEGLECNNAPSILGRDRRDRDGYPDPMRSRSLWRYWPGLIPRTRLKAALRA
jgi:hypothetical protein